MFECFVDCCLNLIGFKDGVGEIESMVMICCCFGDCFVYFGGLLMVEVYVVVYKVFGVLVYLLVVFNFILKMVMVFYEVIVKDDYVMVGCLIDEFFLLYLKICNCCVGYVVSIVKVGVKFVGYDVGLVCVLFVDFIEVEVVEFDVLIRKMGL